VTPTQSASPGSALSQLQTPTGTLSLLSHLAEHGESDGGTLTRALGSREDFYSALERLKSSGFAFEYSAGSRAVRVGLTVSGEKLGRALRPLEKTLEGTLSDKERRLKALDRSGHGDTAEAVSLRLTLAEAAFVGHDWDTALVRARRAAGGAERLQDDPLALRAHLQVARILQKRDDAGAAKALEAALAIAARSGDVRRASEALYLAGSVHERKGRYKEAEVRYREAVERAGTADDPVGVGRAQLGLGRLLGRRGDYEASCEILAGAIRRFETGGLEGEEELPKAYVTMGASAFYRDEAEGVRWHEKGVEAAEKACDVRMLAYALTNASAGYINRGELDRAEKDLVRAREIFARLREARMLAQVDAHLGNVEVGREHWPGAAALFRKAEAAYRRLREPYKLADVLLNHGRMEAKRGRVPEARRLLREAETLFGKIGSAGRSDVARRALRQLTARQTR